MKAKDVMDCPRPKGEPALVHRESTGSNCYRRWKRSLPRKATARAAAELIIHRSTIDYRLWRIDDLTGHSGQPTAALL